MYVGGEMRDERWMILGSGGGRRGGGGGFLILSLSTDTYIGEKRGCGGKRAYCL